MTVRAHRVLSHPEIASLNRSALVVLARILSHLHEQTGRAWPSIELLASSAGLSEKTVRRAIGQITDRGIMNLKPGGGRGRSNVYCFQNPDTQEGRVSDNKLGQAKPKTRTHTAQNPDTLSVPPTEGTEGTEGAPGRAESKADGDDPVAFTFPTAEGKRWDLPYSKLHELRVAYPYVHVDTELEGLAAWTERNPDKRKDPGAMWNWLHGVLRKKQAEKPLESPAFYGDGFVPPELPTDPTGDQIDELFQQAEDT